MILLEKQVCNLELSKRLKELGVMQESLFYWVNWQEDKHKIIQGAPIGWHIENHSHKDCPVVSAFTVAELGEMLPWGIEGGNPPYTTLKILKLQNRGWIVLYKNKGGVLHQDGADTEADARAKMLIYLVENGMLSLEAPKGV